MCTYDSPDDKRRIKLANTLKNFGFRVQFSVFEALLEPEEITRIKNQLENVIDPAFDSVRIYSLCAKCQNNMLILGKGDKIKKQTFIIA